MPFALKKVINSSPHPTIQPIMGQPTYEMLAKVHLKLNTNVASVHSHLGNGQLGILFETIAPAIHRWELPGNYRDFIVVMVFHLFSWIFKRILVTDITGFKIYILIQSLMLFI